MADYHAANLIRPVRFELPAGTYRLLSDSRDLYYFEGTVPPEEGDPAWVSFDVYQTIPTVFTGPTTVWLDSTVGAAASFVFTYGLGGGVQGPPGPKGDKGDKGDPGEPGSALDSPDSIAEFDTAVANGVYDGYPDGSVVSVAGGEFMYIKQTGANLLVNKSDWVPYGRSISTDIFELVDDGNTDEGAKINQMFLWFFNNDDVVELRGYINDVATSVKITANGLNKANKALTGRFQFTATNSFSATEVFELVNFAGTAQGRIVARGRSSAQYVTRRAETGIKLTHSRDGNFRGVDFVPMNTRGDGFVMVDADGDGISNSKVRLAVFPEFCGARCYDPALDGQAGDWTAADKAALVGTVSSAVHGGNDDEVGQYTDITFNTIPTHARVDSILFAKLSYGWDAFKVVSITGNVVRVNVKTPAEVVSGLQMTFVFGHGAVIGDTEYYGAGSGTEGNDTNAVFAEVHPKYCGIGVRWAAKFGGELRSYSFQCSSALQVSHEDHIVRGLNVRYLTGDGDSMPILLGSHVCTDLVFDRSYGLPDLWSLNRPRDGSGVHTAANADARWNTNYPGVLYHPMMPQSSNGGTSWGDPVDANIVPDATDSRNLGSDTNRFSTVHTENLRLAGEDVVPGAGPTGNIVGDTDTQTLTNKTLSDPAILMSFNTRGGSNFTLDPSIDVRGVIADRSTAQICQLPLETHTSVPVGYNLPIVRAGAGTVEIQAQAGVTLNGVDGGSAFIDSQWTSVFVVKYAADTWTVLGAHGGVT